MDRTVPDAAATFIRGTRAQTIQAEQMLTVGSVAVCLEVSRLVRSQQHFVSRQML